MAEYIRYNINDGIGESEHEEWFLIKPQGVNLSDGFINEYKKTIDPTFKYFIEEE